MLKWRMKVKKKQILVGNEKVSSSVSVEALRIWVFSREWTYDVH